MQLTDSEKRDIIKFIESGKPLPDKYRFLLFDDKREVELVWNGKTNEVCNIVLPFQTIEQVDEPRDTGKRKDVSNKKGEKGNMLFFDTDYRGRQLKGWTNKLIWGDNKLILSSLKNGPLRDEIEKEGGINLIYIDPPFDVGADFSMDIEIGDETFHKEPNILEEIAYRDTWGKGADSFIAMIYERLVLMRDLLSEDGHIFVHCDWRVNSFLRSLLDEILGRNCFKNEIVWKRTYSSKVQTLGFGKTHELILYYTKQSATKIKPIFLQPDDDYVEKYFNKIDENGERYQSISLTQKGQGSPKKFGDKILSPPRGMHWIWKQERLDKAYKEGKIIFTKNDFPRYKKLFSESEIKGKPVDDLWIDDGVGPLNSWHSESLDYPTQKPESLISRIIESTTDNNDIVADFFCGSGTTAAVAEKLGRKWITTDLGKFAIHTTRKRVIQVQRQLKEEGKDYRAFELLNLGKYERQHYIGLNPNLREEEKQKQIQEREKHFTDLILHAYKAQPAEGFSTFQGKKAGRLVAVGPINLPVTRLFVEELILECRKNHITRVDVLAFEFEMGLFPNILEEAKAKGIDIAPKYIPRDVFDKRAIEKNQVVFHDVSYIEVKPHIKGKSVAVELTDYSVYYTQDTIDNVAEGLKNGKNKITVDNGQIVKVIKNDKGIVRREVLTKHWTDWIDYWSVDFNFESKREIVRVKNEQSGEVEERWTGDYIFENEWQSFRTKKDRSIELKSIAHEYEPGRYKIAVKVVDIFGNDTMKIVEVTIGGKK